MNIKQVIGGKEYDVCYPDSWYIASLVCKEHHDGYVLKCENSGFVSKIFMHSKKTVPCRYDKEDEHCVIDKNAKCLGWLIWYPETDTVVLRKTQVDTEKHEFHTGEALAISYDIFKNLRDHDIIQIYANTKDKDGNTVPMIYKIKKYKAAKVGDFKHFGEHGLQYFIPVDAFHKEVDIRATKPKATKKKKHTTKKKSLDRS